MEREQIIKCLEYCKDRGYQDGCPRLRNDKLTEDECRLDLIHETLSLIKELLQANEMLSESYDHLEKTKDELLAERSRLTEENESLRVDNEILKIPRATIFEISNAFERGHKKAKADTVKKMQERLKAEAGYFGRAVAVEVIDQIAKEMLNENTEGI